MTGSSLPGFKCSVTTATCLKDFMVLARTPIRAHPRCLITKTEFVKRVQQRFKGHYRADEVEALVVAVFDEIKLVIQEGDELHLNNFGRFYPKEMQSRVVRGGWYQVDKKEYLVPKKTKIGFSSFPTTDRFVSQPSKKKIRDDDDDFFNY